MARIIAQLDGIHRHGEPPKTPTSPTIEQLLRGPDPSRWSPRSSPTFGREHDMEEDHTHTPTHRKSVLAKVKDKAKKWRNTLSKKKHNEDGNATPSWGVSLEDEDDDDEDPEYLGAPMYESEMAPEGYKETARQHPRVIPAIIEKHVPTINTAKSVRTTPSPRSASRTTPQVSPKAATTPQVSPKAATTPQVSPKAATTPTTLSKTMSETVAEKLAPAYATVTEATYAIASKIQSLAISAPEQQIPSPKTESPPSKSSVSPKSPRSPASSLATYSTIKGTLAPIIAPNSSNQPTRRALTRQESTKHKEVTFAPELTAPAAIATTSNPVSTTEQIWDKGVSVKEYIMQKLEPGEDEKALSQVITEAISPKKGSGDVSVVEKVREAVTTLLRNNGLAQNQSQEQQQKRVVFHSAQNSASNIPMSINAHEVVEEENYGRILQAN
ncbi:low-temperature-induced 65 kDa protein [Mercurialis annua]|uniref:low-temperature-induced 65 kDa protein n=1 Tax=Mercurialis annua TaxID=3986 RepID=UPI00215DD717|nr:low-temperature-induced 65 kDa protein [Mercurialis annua]